ncbi:unnamed protein product, partial [Ascophyllum nodosum]
MVTCQGSTRSELIDPMAYGGLNMDATAEIGRNPVSTRFSLSMENEQADAGRDVLCLFIPRYAASRLVRTSGAPQRAASPCQSRADPSGAGARHPARPGWGKNNKKG